MFFKTLWILILIWGCCSQNQWPTVMVALFVRNKGHLLKNTLALLQKQDYPKDRISLYIRSDHNEDNTIDILEHWLENSTEYHSKDVILNRENVRFGDQNQGPLEWSDSRFFHMINLKQGALEHARFIWADWVWFLDADVFLTSPETLKDMVLKNDMVIVSPLLTSVGLYSNFWAGMTESYYYTRTEDYKPILERKRKGCFAVPMVHSSFFVNLKKKESAYLSFETVDEDLDDEIPFDDIIRFAISAKFNGIELNICNEMPYGYIMLPLEDKQTFEDDLDNLTNLKTEIFAYGNLLPFDTEKETEVDSLDVDQIYLVNLDRRPDRLRNMQEIFNELRIDYKRIRAIDGKIDVTEDYLDQMGIRMMSDFSEPFHGRPLTHGEIGCFMSHYNIWQDVVQQKFREIIVFEDDVRFEPFFRQKLNSVRDELEHMDWDLVFLGRKILHNVEENWVENSKWLVHVNYTYWTLGYMMTFQGAQKLIRENPLGKMVPVDEYLPIMYDRHPNETWKSHYENRNLKAFSVHPLLLFPTHYTGEEGYVSDTEDTPVIATNHDEL